jgi:hypothetical protein
MAITWITRGTPCGAPLLTLCSGVIVVAQHSAPLLRFFLVVCGVFEESGGVGLYVARTRKRIHWQRVCGMREYGKEATQEVSTHDF